MQGHLTLSDVSPVPNSDIKPKGQARIQRSEVCRRRRLECIGLCSATEWIQSSPNAGWRARSYRDITRWKIFSAELTAFISVSGRHHRFRRGGVRIQGVSIWHRAALHGGKISAEATPNSVAQWGNLGRSHTKLCCAVAKSRWKSHQTRSDDLTLVCYWKSLH